MLAFKVFFDCVEAGKQQGSNLAKDAVAISEDIRTHIKRDKACSRRPDGRLQEPNLGGLPVGR